MAIKKRKDSDPQKMVDWVINKIRNQEPEGGYKSIKSVETQLQLLKQTDEHTKIFFRPSIVAKHGRDATSVTNEFNQEVSAVNKSYAQRVDSMIEEATRYNRKETLDKLKEQVLANTEEYEEDTVKSLKEIINGAEKAIENNIGEVIDKEQSRIFDEMNKSIQNASTLQDLDRIDESILSNKKDQRQLRFLKSEKEVELGGVEKELRQDINQLNSIGGYDSLRNKIKEKSISTPSENRLLSMLESKKRELEQQEVR